MNNKYQIQFIIMIGLVGSILNLSAQTQGKVFSTSKYAGTYSFGENVEKGPVGQVAIYPESDSTILFYVDVCKGAPSYNLGQLYSRLLIKDGSAIYYSKERYAEKGCKLNFTIKNNLLTIVTLDNCYECGFGANVIADNRYKIKNNTRPEFFVNGEGLKVFFNKTSPENYLK